jgi:hypothetical protein
MTKIELIERRIYLKRQLIQHTIKEVEELERQRKELRDQQNKKREAA